MFLKEQKLVTRVRIGKSGHVDAPMNMEVSGSAAKNTMARESRGGNAKLGTNLAGARTASFSARRMKRRRVRAGTLICCRLALPERERPLK